ncbi:MAG TPA: hypothetical protein VGP43_04235 [Chitinophagaceae bacterium]|nr:hypothetical protein [Chitinophagaceae bacterium]
MKKIKVFLFTMLLLFSTIIFAQQKTPPAPPAPPAPPELKVAPQPPPEMKLVKPAQPNPTDIKGHPWTRNGQTVWVVKPPKPIQSPKPPKPPIPPPPPPKQIEL